MEMRWEGAARGYQTRDWGELVMWPPTDCLGSCRGASCRFQSSTGYLELDMKWAKILLVGNRAGTGPGLEKEVNTSRGLAIKRKTQLSPSPN